MARIILITGGSRSGKSAYAQKLAETLAGPRALVATCPIIDDEMRERVRKHQKARSQGAWDTIEETIDLSSVLRHAKKYRVLLIDCLTLWSNNLMYEAGKCGREMEEEEIEELSRELLAACSERPGAVIFVTNEVGMGVVPENALARRYRDLLGRCNQVMAAGAHDVTFVVCGIPLRLKGGQDDGLVGSDG